MRKATKFLVPVYPEQEENGNIAVITGVWRVLFADLERRRAFVSDQKLYSLEILRNTFRSSGRETCTNSNAVTHQHFYLFDYFDRLACVTEVDYHTHFGILPHKTAPSEQHITLQAISQNRDPFIIRDRIRSLHIR